MNEVFPHRCNEGFAFFVVYYVSMWKWIGGCLSLISSGLFAQHHTGAVSAIYMGLGAYSQHQHDVFAALQQQASLARMDLPVVGAYAENRFLLKENRACQAAAAIPTAYGNFGVRLFYQGYHLFNNMQLGMAYGRSLGKQVDVGIQFNLSRRSFKNLGVSMNMEGGFLFHLTERLTSGIHVYNPMGSFFSKRDDLDYAVYKVGLGWDVSDCFFVGGEIIQEQTMEMQWAAGFLYQFNKRFFLRGGLAGGSCDAYFSAGVAWKKKRLDVTASHHTPLGWSPGFMFAVDLK